MKKTVIILMCLLLLAFGMPLFAQSHNGQHVNNGHQSRSDHDGRSDQHKAENEHHWHGSDVHPAYHGVRGWGDAPSRAPAGKPAPLPPKEPVEDPGDKPAEEPGEQPADKGPTQPLILNPHHGAFPG